MSKDDCRFELPKGWKEDSVYTRWLDVVSDRLISEFLQDLYNLLGIGKIPYSYEPIKELLKKWEEKLK